MRLQSPTPVLRRARLLGLLLTPLVTAGLFWARSPADGPANGEIREIVAELSRLTGLKAVQNVRAERIARPQVTRFLEERIKEAVKPDDIRSEELTLKKFGFVPADFDLKKTTVDLLSEQAAAFYDFHKKKLFMIDAGGDDLQHSALVHELAHALADQHFNLERFIEKGSKNDDTALARLAVMEGQATWLMSEYLTRRTGQSLLDSPVLVKMMSRMTAADSGQFPVFQSAPLYLRESLIFPYTQGMLFQHAVLEKMGKQGFSEVFRHPPVSTQQIIHPEKYFQGVKPTMPRTPEPAGGGYRDFADGAVGEFDMAVLLKQFAGDKEADALAPKWKGGFFRLLERGKDGRMVLSFASEWESADAARDFFRCYRQVLEKKWKSLHVSIQREDLLAGSGDDGHFAVKLAGSIVTCLEGASSAEEAGAGRGTLERAGAPGELH